MRCKECPGSDGEAKVIAEAFGLPGSRVWTRGERHYRIHKNDRLDLNGFERAMWHALVRSYYTIVNARKDINCTGVIRV